MGKKKIAIIELYGHSEVLYVLFKLLENDFELTVFTTQEIHLDAKDYFGTTLNNWQIKPSNISIEDFIQERLVLLDSQNLILFITLISSIRFFSKMNFRPLTIAVIHNVNTSFNFDNSIWVDKSSIQNYTFDVIKFLRSKIRREVFFKHKLLQKINYISFSSKNLSIYAKSISPKFQDKIIEPLPFSFFEEAKIGESESQIIISISGRVDNRLRDYEVILNTLKEIIPFNKKKIILQLLGSTNRSYGEKLVREIEDLENDNFKLVYFEKLLSQKEFDYFLKRTDFMILPSKRHKKFGIIKEEYGKSTISGGLNEIVRFGIPTLLSDSYKTETKFEPLISTFRDQQELLEKLNDWIEHSRYLEIKNTALPKLEKINEENTRTKLVNRIEKLLK